MKCANWVEKKRASMFFPERVGFQITHTTLSTRLVSNRKSKMKQCMFIIVPGPPSPHRCYEEEDLYSLCDGINSLYWSGREHQGWQIYGRISVSLGLVADGHMCSATPTAPPPNDRWPTHTHTHQGPGVPGIDGRYWVMALEWDTPRWSVIRPHTS